MTFTIQSSTKATETRPVQCLKQIKSYMVLNRGGTIWNKRLLQHASLPGKKKMAALGPGFLIVGSFIGPGTVTSSTRAGATYGFQLFWCVIFSVIAVIVVQGMWARRGPVPLVGVGAAE